MNGFTMNGLEQMFISGLLQDNCCICFGHSELRPAEDPSLSSEQHGWRCGGSSNQDDSTTSDFRRWTLINTTISAQVFTYMSKLCWSYLNSWPDEFHHWDCCVWPPGRRGYPHWPAWAALHLTPSFTCSRGESPANITGNTFCVPSVHF